MKTRIFFSCVLATLLVWAVCEAQAQVSVNCNSGQTITQALQSAPISQPITIIISGTCNENVVIDRDDVTLKKGLSGGTVNGPNQTKATITVNAARTVIDGLAVTRGRSGITVLGSATIQNCTVQNTGQLGVISSGIAFYHGGQGTVDNCVVRNNASYGIAIEGGSATVIKSTISANTDAGIVVSLGGSARIGLDDFLKYAGNTISDNKSNGIMIDAGGSAFIGGNTIQGNGTNLTSLLGQYGIAIYRATAVLVGYNRIIGNSGSGVFARSSTVQIGDPAFGLPITGRYANVITNNGSRATFTGGIFGGLGSALEIRNTTINGNTGNGVTLIRRSTARMFDDVVNNNTNGIQLFQGAGLLLDDPAVTVTGNTSFGLQCADAESSFAGNTSGISGNTGGQVSPSCTGF
jgi:hypothetical protein